MEGERFEALPGPQIGREALARFLFGLGCFALVVRSSVFDGVSFDPFALKQDGLTSHLADVVGVSRTLVRQALQHLVHDHLVALEPNRGARIAVPSIDEVRQLYEVRRLIECNMLAEGAARLTRARLAALRRKVASEAQASSISGANSLPMAMWRSHSTSSRGATCVAATTTARSCASWPPGRLALPSRPCAAISCRSGRA